MRGEAISCRRRAYQSSDDAPRRLLEMFRSSVPVPPAAAVSGFWPMGEEIDIRPLMLALHGDGHPIGLPATGPRGTVLRFRRWDPATTLVSGVFGTREPPADAPEIVPRLLLVPLLAFDDAGSRLGYGGGYYDRTIAALRANGPLTTVGVAFAAQRVEAVPHDSHDQPLDWIVTEDAALHVAPAPQERKPT